MAALDLLSEVGRRHARCCSSPRTPTGSIARRRTCSPSSPAGWSPTRSCCWPPSATATRPCSRTPGCRSSGSTPSTRRWRRELLDAIGSEQLTRSRERDRILREAAGNPLALIELPIAAAHPERGTPEPGCCRSRSGSSGRSPPGSSDLPRRDPPAAARRGAERRRRASARSCAPAAPSPASRAGRRPARAGRSTRRSSSSTCRRSGSAIR